MHSVGLLQTLMYFSTRSIRLLLPELLKERQFVGGTVTEMNDSWDLQVYFQGGRAIFHSTETMKH